MAKWYYIFIILTITLIGYFIFILDYEGMCSDREMPKGAIAFAYEHMITKDNVTFVSIEPNLFEDYCERHYWVTDTEGVNYRLVWSKMHHDIKLNESYTIKYTDGNGIFKSLWECEIKNSS